MKWQDGEVLGVDAIQTPSSVVAVCADILECLPIEVVDVVFAVVEDVVFVGLDELLGVLL